MAIVSVLIAAAALVGPPASASATSISNLVFRGAAQSRAELTSDTAVALDATGKALFVAGPDFLFDFAGNPGRRIQEWDSARQLVRISADGLPPVWLRCSDLKTMPIACTTMRLRVLGNGKVEIGQPVGGVRALDDETSGMPDARGIPACPGDPRCPRPGG